MSDPRLINMSQAVVNVSRECIAAGVAAEDVIEAVCDGLSQLLTVEYSPEQAAALLRIEAGRIEDGIIRNAQSVDTEVEREAKALVRKGHEFINAMQVAGLQEPTIVSALMLVLVERVTRTNGVAAAAGWLNRMAAMALANGDDLGKTSQAH
jgi:hypothetical protein